MFTSLWLSSLKRQLRTRFSRSSRARRNRNQRHQLPSTRALISRNAAEALEDRTLLTSVLSIDDVIAPENGEFTFEISLDEAAGSDITVLLNTVTDTADDTDYTFLKNKIVTIAAGELSTQVTVHVHDDDNQESDEAFSLVLSDPRIGGESLPSAVTIADGTGQGTILNDDGLPGSVFTVSGEKIAEGDDANQVLKFTITRTGGSLGDLNFATSVDFSTVNGTAVAGEDYTGKIETIHFSANPYATSQTSVVSVFVQGDTFKELSEAVIGRLSNPTGGSALKGNVSSLDAVGIIANDDSDFVFQNTFSADPVHANHTEGAFGRSVAIDGDVMVIGAPYNSLHGYSAGVVYVYTRNQQGTLLDQSDDTWDYATFLQPLISGDSFSFGISVDIYGDTIVVGAERDSSGAVYVYSRVGDDWKSEPPLVEEIRVAGLSPYAYFGTSVAIYENTIVVGAHTSVQGVSIDGAAYVFEKTGDDWSAPSMRELVHPVPDYDDYFGDVVTIHDGVIVIGAPVDNSNGARSGAAYVYTIVGESWLNQPPLVTKLTASDGESSDNFGLSVATNGTDILIGAPNSSKNGTLSGSVYLYSKIGLDWFTTSPREIKLIGAHKNHRFGATVSIGDNQMIVGTTRAQEIPGHFGAAYVYTKNGFEWSVDTATESVLIPIESGYSAFGFAVAISNGTILIGAFMTSLDGEGSGGAYVYEIAEDNSWSITNEIKPTDPLTSHHREENFGRAIAVSDDYLVIGAPGTDSTLAPTGIVYVYARNDASTPGFFDDDTWEYETSFIDPVPEANLEFGTSVTIDGTTIVVTAETASAPYGAEAFVFTRNGSDWVTIPPTVTPLLANASRTMLKEISVAIQNDTIVVGHKGGTGVTQSGAVYVYERKGIDWSTITPTETIISPSDGAENDYFGIAVDLDDDQIIVGATDNENRGAAYLYQKGSTGWSSAAEYKLIGSDIQLDDKFGRLVAIDGNTVAITARGIGSGYSGAVYMFDGTEGWLSPIETRFDPISDTSNFNFGRSIDLDGKLLVVTDSVSLNHFLTGSAYIYDGSEGWEKFEETIISYTDDSELFYRRFGYSNAAINQNSLFVAALYEGLFSRNSFVYSYNRSSSAEVHLRVVNSPTNTQPNGEASSLPSNQDNVSEWSSYWVEIWVNASNPENQGVFSAQLNLDYNTEYTSATEIEFGSGFTQNQTGTINDVAGTIEGLYAETTASDLGTDSYLLFARIKFESLAEDQVELDLSGKSIGPYDLGFNISSQQVKLIGDLPTVTNPGQFNSTSIWANPFDLNDDDAINFRDLVLLINSYSTIPSESNSDYSWFADLNQNNRVDFGDLVSFINNYGKTKANQSPVSYPQNFPNAWNKHLTVDPVLLPQVAARPVDQADAESVLDGVVEYLDPQLTSDENEKLTQVNIEVVDLPDGVLSNTVRGTIYIDTNATGYGWFVDDTPGDNSEFYASSALSLTPFPFSDAVGKVDLWSVILHELGHLLGHEHETDGVMQETLAPGVRNLPDWADDDTDSFFSTVIGESELLFF